MIRNKIGIQDKTNDFYDSMDEKVYDFPYDKLELQEYQTDQEEEFLKDQISSDITNKYNTIVMKQIEINKLKTNLEIKTKELEIMKTKLRIRMITAKQLDEDGVKDIMDEGTPDIPHKNSPKYIETDDEGNASFDYGKYAIAIIQYQQEVSGFSQDLTAYHTCEVCC